MKPSFRLRNGELVERGPDDCPSASARWLARRSRIFALLRRVEIRVARSFGAGPWFALNAAILDELRADSERAGVPLLFVHIPYQTWRPFPALARYMERTGSEFIDLYDELGEEWSNSYFPRDGHLNTEGHRRLADLVAVRAASLLPARR